MYADYENIKFIFLKTFNWCISNKVSLILRVSFHCNINKCPIVNALMKYLLQMEYLCVFERKVPNVSWVSKTPKVLKQI